MKPNAKECSDNLELISLLASGCANHEEFTAVERHVAQCSECAGRLHEMQLLTQGLQRAAKSEDTLDAAEMSIRVLEAVRVTKAPVVPMKQAWSIPAGWMLAGLAASVFVLIGVWKSIQEREDKGSLANLVMPIHGEKSSPLEMQGPPRWCDWNRALGASDEALEVLFAYDAGGLAWSASDQSSLLLEMGKR